MQIGGARKRSLALYIKRLRADLESMHCRFSWSESRAANGALPPIVSSDVAPRRMANVIDVAVDRRSKACATGLREAIAPLDAPESHGASGTLDARPPAIAVLLGLLLSLWSR